jgi:hypothetical protein
LPSFLSSHPSLSIPALDAFQLQLTPFNSTPTSFQAPGAKMLLIGVAYDASSQHSNGSSPDVTAGAAEEGEHRKTSDNEPFFLGGPPYSLTAAEVRALYEPRGVDVVERGTRRIRAAAAARTRGDVDDRDDVSAEEAKARGGEEEETPPRRARADRRLRRRDDERGAEKRTNGIGIGIGTNERTNER